MRTKITAVVGAAFMLFTGGLCFAQASQQTLAPSNADLQTTYDEGVKAYYQKDYTKAVTIFHDLQEKSPEYRKFQVARYLSTSEARNAGTQNNASVFKVVDQPSTQIEVKREGEFEAVTEEAQKVLLDASNAFETLKKEDRYSDFELLSVTSTLKMAREAYENEQYVEAVRLANKARFKIIDLNNQLKPGMTVGPMGDKLVSLQLMDSDLEQTLKLIYDLTGANIVMSKDIKGRVTINVKDLPLQQVLDLICESNNLKYFEDKSVIKIMTRDEFEKSPALMKAKLRKVFPVLYNDAGSIAKALRETFKLSTIVYEPRTNSIVIDVPDETTAGQVAEVISALDSPISEVLLEAKFVEVSINDANSYGIDWLFASRLLEHLGSATLTGPKFGFNPAFTPGVSASLPDNSFSFGVTSNDVNVLLNAISTKGKVRLLQSPKIMCLNGTSASLRVTTNVPYIIPTASTTAGTTTSTSTTSFTVINQEVGTEFYVTPIIQKNRNIFLSLDIADSRLVELRQLRAISGGSTYETTQPIISSRETTQNIVVFDGQTLVIGGMVQETKSMSTTGVPFLQRIPLLGALFRKPQMSNTKSEMLLFITPRIVSNFEDSVQLTKPEEKKANDTVDGGLIEHF